MNLPRFAETQFSEYVAANFGEEVAEVWLRRIEKAGPVSLSPSQANPPGADDWFSLLQEILREVEEENAQARNFNFAGRMFTST